MARMVGFTRIIRLPWLNKTIELPVDPDLYFEELSKRIATSKFEKKDVVETVADLSGTYNSK